LPPGMRPHWETFVRGARTVLELSRVIRERPELRRQFRRVIAAQLLIAAALTALSVHGSLRALALAYEPHRRFDVSLDRSGLNLKTQRDDADGRGPGVHVAGEAFVAAHAPALLPLWIGLVVLYGSWVISEWIACALYRDHNDFLGDELARALGSEVPPSKPPRVRLDLRWVIRRVLRQIAGAVVFASGLPLFFAARLLPGVLGRVVYPITLVVWGGYWFVVMTAGKSDSAWNTPATRLPWFLRGWRWLTEHVPGFRWFLPRAYGTLWTRVSRKSHLAAERVERAPAEFAGLSAVRLLCSLPIASVYLRPLLPVAASRIAAAPSATDG
jgi:hypothetical protein